MTHTIKLEGYAATAADCGCGRCLTLGTADSYGIETLQLLPGEGWQGLALTATFHPASGEPVQILADADGLVAVPAEATADCGRSAPGRIVISGTAEGVRRIAAELNYTVTLHAGAEGGESQQPVPGLMEQALEQIAAARQAAETAVQNGTALLVTLTAAEDGSYTATPAFAEVLAAYNAGRTVVCRHPRDNWVLPVVYADEHQIIFYSRIDPEVYSVSMGASSVYAGYGNASGVVTLDQDSQYNYFTDYTAAEVLDWLDGGIHPVCKYVDAQFHEFYMPLNYAYRQDGKQYAQFFGVVPAPDGSSAWACAVTLDGDAEPIFRMKLLWGDLDE